MNRFWSGFRLSSQTSHLIHYNLLGLNWFWIWSQWHLWTALVFSWPSHNSGLCLSLFFRFLRGSENEPLSSPQHTLSGSRWIRQGVLRNDVSEYLAYLHFVKGLIHLILEGVCLCSQGLVSHRLWGLIVPELQSTRVKHHSKKCCYRSWTEKQWLVLGWSCSTDSNTIVA